VTSTLLLTKSDRKILIESLHLYYDLLYDEPSEKREQVRFMIEAIDCIIPGKDDSIRFSND